MLFDQVGAALLAGFFSVASALSRELAVCFVCGLGPVRVLFSSKLKLLLLELLLLFFLSQQVLLELVQLSHLIIYDLVMIAAAGVGAALDAGGGALAS